MECVIYQSLLHKTPPLDKLIVTWKKRWFILSQKDPFDPRSVELTYYTDSNKSEKRGTIPVSNITRIHPSPSKSKGHIFSIELKDKKIMLKAEDAKTKSIWICKLYEFAGHGHNYHVTVPHQPVTDYNEGLLQLGRADSELTILPPASSSPILNIPFSQIRRFGYQVVLENYDVMWFELCECQAKRQEFCFFVVASGMDRAMLIAGDLKTKIEKDTGKFLILEEDKHPESVYISRGHYGCAPYPKLGRDRIMHAGLVNLEATKMISVSSKRRPSVPPTFVSPLNERRSTVQYILGGTSPRPSPANSPSPTRSPSPSSNPNPNSKGVPLKSMTKRSGVSGSCSPVPGSTSDPTVQYTGKTLSAFDQGRRSDQCYLTMSDGAASLSNWRSKRPSEPTLVVPKSNTLDRKRSPKFATKSTLLDLHTERASSASSPSQEKFFPSKDSGIGTSADLVLDHNGHTISPLHSASPCRSPSPRSSPRSKMRSGSQPAVFSYDHHPSRKTSVPQVSYDRLGPMDSKAPNLPSVPPRSGVSLGDSYVDF